MQLLGISELDFDIKCYFSSWLKEIKMIRFKHEKYCNDQN